MAMYLSMFIDHIVATDMPDNITMIFKITKRNMQLPFPVILVSKNTVKVKLAIPPIATSMQERIAMRKLEIFFLNCEDIE